MDGRARFARAAQILTCDSIKQFTDTVERFIYQQRQQQSQQQQQQQQTYKTTPMPTTMLHRLQQDLQLAIEQKSGLFHSEMMVRSFLHISSSLVEVQALPVHRKRRYRETFPSEGYVGIQHCSNSNSYSNSGGGYGGDDDKGWITYTFPDISVPHIWLPSPVHGAVASVSV